MPTPSPAPRQPATTSPLAPIASQNILRGQASVTIDHDGQLYILRVTRENKLILTK